MRIMEDQRDAEEEARGRVMVINKSDIYRFFSPFQRQMILITGGMIALLTPFCDTVYLPALEDVTIELQTTQALTSITVSAYLGAVGLGQLIWGPLSDKYGRLPVLFSTLFIFEALTIGIIFIGNIIDLIVLRTIEGLFVGSCIVSVQAIIADVFAPEERGAAMSYFLGPMLIGPIIAPLIGGVLAQTFSWRADFVLLAVMTVPMALFAYIFNPETHHWYLVKSKSKMLEDMIRKREGEIESNDLESNFQSNSNAVVIALDECKELSHKDMDNGMTVINDLNDDSIFINSDVDSIKKNSIKEDNFQSLSNSVDKIDYSVKEEDISDILEPELMMPWTVAAYLLDPELAAYYSAVGFTFACMFTSLTILPQFLVKPPYLLDATITGVSFLPVGVAMLLGALIGGKLSDWSGKRFSNVADGQMIAVLLISWMCPLGFIGFGFALQNGNPLYGVLLLQCIDGFGQAVLMPGTLSFLSTVRPDTAGAAGAAMLFLCFALSCISISVSTIVYDLIGVGYFCLALSAITSIALGFSTWICIYRIFYRNPKAII